MALEIDLSGRVAIVTGGSRGLGRADALTLERAGAEVVVLDIEEANTTIQCDVGDRRQVDEAVRRTVEDFGSVDILVNNAGTLDHLGQFPDQQRELWERDLRVNLTRAFNCAEAGW